MAPTLDERIEALLDQLENPGMKDGDIERLEKKLRILQAQKV